MRRITAFPVAALMVMGLVTMAGAHLSNPEGYQHFAFQFEDDAVPTIDGDASDWSFVPAFNYLPTDGWWLPQSDHKVPTEEDYTGFRPALAYGWNDSNNRFYVLVEIWDDYHNATRENVMRTWLDDSVELKIVPAHVGADLLTPRGAVGHDGTSALDLLFGVPFPAEEQWNMNPGFGWNEPGSPTLDFGWSHDGPMLGGPTTYTYEFSLELPWTIAETLEETDMLDLEEGEVIHAQVSLCDVDEGGEFILYWSTQFGTGVEFSSDPQQDVVFDEIDPNVDQMTAVAQSSWGLIKAGFSK
jgi:hypothetical protein